MWNKTKHTYTQIRIRTHTWVWKVETEGKASNVTNETNRWLFFISCVIIVIINGIESKQAAMIYSLVFFFCSRNHQVKTAHIRCKHVARHTVGCCCLCLVIRYWSLFFSSFSFEISAFLFVHLPLYSCLLFLFVECEAKQSKTTAWILFVWPYFICTGTQSANNWNRHNHSSDYPIDSMSDIVLCAYTQYT